MGAQLVSNGLRAPRTPPIIRTRRTVYRAHVSILLLPHYATCVETSPNAYMRVALTSLPRPRNNPPLLVIWLGLQCILRGRTVDAPHPKRTLSKRTRFHVRHKSFTLASSHPNAIPVCSQ